LEHWQKVRAIVEKKFGGSKKVDEMFPPEAYQLTHNALFPHDCVHVENMGGEMSNPALHNKRIVLGAFPWNFRGGEAAFCRAVAFTEN
jgi:kynurenine formamidase